MADPIPMQIPDGFGLWTLTLQTIYGPKQYSFNLGYQQGWVSGANHAQDLWTIISDTGGPFDPSHYTDRYHVVKAHALAMDAGVLHVMEYSINVAGSGAWESPPPNTAVLVQKRTGVAGRNKRGRMFIPPTVVSEANVDTLGIIASTPLTAMQTAWNQFHDDMNSGGFIPCLLHGGTKAAPGVAPVPTVIDSFGVEAMVATQRRRLR